MKNRVNLKRQPAAFMLLCMAVCLLFISWSCTSQKAELTPQRAYTLRMDGNADSAEVILEQILSADSTNAVAWYELARTKHHIGLGNPRLLIGHLPDLQHSIDKAVEYDPDNVIYVFYQGYLRFFKSYATIMMGQPGAKENIQETIAAYESVLDLKPDYYEAMLFLVEALSIPSEMGGDSSRAETLAVKLEEMDAVKGAKAKELLLAADVDRIEYWQNILEENPDNAEVLEQLGKANLYQDKVDAGTEYLETALQLEPEKHTLLLDLARYHIMTGMQDSTKKDAAIPLAEKYLERYLATNPIAPLKAYTIELQAKLQNGLGDEEGAAKLREEAQKTDPNYSKAFGVPPALLFTKLDEISRYHSYFFRPL